MHTSDNIAAAATQGLPAEFLKLAETLRKVAGPLSPIADADADAYMRVAIADDPLMQEYIAKHEAGQLPLGVVIDLNRIRQRRVVYAAAVGYIEAGWPIFRLAENSKDPLKGSRGFYDATTDRAQIDAWFGGDDGPVYNIGLWPEPAGMGVIDLDGDEGSRNWQAFCAEHGIDPELYAAHTVRSPHGGHTYCGGSLPQTTHRIAPKIDTRGITGYVLIPPSHVVYEDGSEGDYTWECEAPFDAWQLPPIPEWIVEACKPRTEEIRRALHGLQEDKPESVREAKLWLASKAPPVEGDGSDGKTFAAAARLYRDLGLSFDTTLELLQTWAPDFDEEWLAEKIENASQYGQNDRGVDAPTSTAEAFAGAVAALPAVQNLKAQPEPATAPAPSRFTPHNIRENLTPPEFYDDEKMLPDIPGGCIGILYGEWGAHKTNTALTKAFDAMEKGCKVLYAAGEGAYGVEADRVPAHCKARGLPLAWTFGKFGIVPALPLFANEADVIEFVEAIKATGFKPDIIVLDTLATATAGQDENSSLMAAHLTDNGMAGYIKKGLGGALVLILAHEGKDSARGVRGHSGIEGNADFVLRIEHKKDAGALRLTAKKMRDGEDQHSAYYKVEANGVPVPKRISADEYRKLIGKDPQAAANKDEQIVKWLLRSNGYETWAQGCEDKELARLWTEHVMHGPRPGKPGEDGVAEWDDEYVARLKALQNAANQGREWTRGCVEKKHQRGGTEQVRRWFHPPDEEIPF